jgi:hypothetical protein
MGIFRHFQQTTTKFFVMLGGNSVFTFDIGSAKMTLKKGAEQ